MSDAAEQGVDPPTTAELHRRLREQREDGQLQWQEIRGNTARIKRMEGKIDRVLDEVGAMSGHMQALSREVGSKVDKNGRSNGSHGDRLSVIEAWMNRRKGVSMAVDFVLRSLLPAGFAVAGTLYYTGQG